MQRQLQDTGDDKDKQEYLRRVDKRGNEYPLVLAASAHAVLAQLPHLDVAADVPREREQRVQGESDDYRGRDLERDDLDHERGGHLLG